VCDRQHRSSSLKLWQWCVWQTTQKQFIDAVRRSDVLKLAKLAGKGLDPNFHEADTGGMCSYGWMSTAAILMFLTPHGRRAKCCMVWWNLTICPRRISPHQWLGLVWTPKTENFMQFQNISAPLVCEFYEFSSVCEQFQVWLTIKTWGICSRCWYMQVIVISLDKG